jgi:rare lipoprotein A
VIRYALVAAALAALTFNSAHASGWSSVHKYVKPTGSCSGGQEILASYYSSGARTASGHAFDANGNTAAARSWAMGTSLTVTNPHNGRTVTVVINDRGPYGTAYRVGARLDLALGAARRIGMRGARYVCVM